MTEQKGGASRNITQPTSSAGAITKIEVEDNGPGMDEATRKRIFALFFTAKPIALGKGLGLAVFCGLRANCHQGIMEVESESGPGTGFIIRLPL